MKSDWSPRPFIYVLSLSVGAWLLCEGILKAATRLVLTSSPELFFVASALPALLAAAQLIFLTVLSIRFFQPGFRLRNGFISLILMALFIRAAHLFR